MNFTTATFRSNSVPFSYCTSCSNLLHSHPFSSSVSSRSRNQHLFSSRLVFSRNPKVLCKGFETQSDPESNDDKDKEEHQEGEISEANATDLELNSQSISADQDKEPPVVIEKLDQILANNSGVDTNPEGGPEGADDVQVTSGSPLPGVKPQQLDESIRI